MELSGTNATGSEKDFSGSDYVSNWYRYDVKGNSNQKVVTHTFLYNGRQLRNYTMLYDRTKKAALWSAFAMNAGMYPQLVTRSDSWQYDPAIDQSWQPKLTSSYSSANSSFGGGYTRGHQVASNDRKTTLYQMYQTDYFTNMTPQTDAFNAGSSTAWDDLEGKIQTLGYNTTGRDTVYVVTGAIFGEGYKTDAKDNNNVSCPVPTQYYKCVLKVTFDSNGVAQSARGGAFLFDHAVDEQGTPGVQQNKTINDLEQLTGFDFFANIPISEDDGVENKFTALW